MRNPSGLPFALLFSLLSLGSAFETFSQSAPARPPSATPMDGALAADNVRPEDPAQAADPSVKGTTANGQAARPADAAKRQEAAPAKAVQAESVEAAGGASTKRVLIIGAVVLAVAALAILIGSGGGGSSGGGY